MFLLVNMLDIHSGDVFRCILCINMPILCETKLLGGKISRTLNNKLVGALYLRGLSSNRGNATIGGSGFWWKCNYWGNGNGKS